MSDPASSHYGEVYKADDGWRFRIKAGNGEIIATGEAYHNKGDAWETAESLLSEVDRVTEVDE